MWNELQKQLFLASGWRGTWCWYPVQGLTKTLEEMVGIPFFLTWVDINANPCASWVSNKSPCFCMQVVTAPLQSWGLVFPEGIVGIVLGIAEAKLGTFRVDCPKLKACNKRALLVGFLHRNGCPLRQDGKCALTLEQYAEVLFCAVASLVSWRVQRSNDIEIQKEWEDYIIV